MPRIIVSSKLGNQYDEFIKSMLVRLLFSSAEAAACTGIY